MVYPSTASHSSDEPQAHIDESASDLLLVSLVSSLSHWNNGHRRQGHPINTLLFGKRLKLRQRIIFIIGRVENVHVPNFHLSSVTILTLSNSKRVRAGRDAKSHDKGDQAQVIFFTTL